MAKYHLNDDNVPGVCVAQKSCRFGGADEHYTSKEAVQKASETALEKKHGAITSEKKAAYPLVPFKATEYSRKVGKPVRTREQYYQAIVDEYERVKDVEALSPNEYFEKKGFNVDPGAEIFAEPYGSSPVWKVVIDESDHPDSYEKNDEDWTHPFDERAVKNPSVTPLAPRNFNTEYHEDYYSGDSYRVKEWVYPIEQKDLEHLKDTDLKKNLQNSKEIIMNPELPNWYALDRNERVYIAPPPSRVKAIDNLIQIQKDVLSKSGTTQASKRIAKRAQDIKKLETDRNYIKSYITDKTPQVVKETLIYKLDETEKRLFKTQQLQAKDLKANSSEGIESVQKKIDTLKKEQDELRAKHEQDVYADKLKKLASHHPAENKRTRTAEAKKWVKAHPNATDFIK